MGEVMDADRSTDEGAPRKYFPGLDGLRFAAAFAVIIVHVEQVKALCGYANGYSFVAHFPMAVTFFFVLSGFLITHLLLEEKRASGTICLKRFYMRRALRIWPLYFLIVLGGLLLLPLIPALDLPEVSPRAQTDLVPKLFLFLFMLPQVAFVVFYPVPYVAQSWSIGVEEQFYLLWPLLLKHTRRAVASMCLIILVMAAARNIAEYAICSRRLTMFFELTQLGAMSIGGMAAYCLVRQVKWPLRWLCNRYAYGGAIVLVVLLFAKPVAIPYVGWEVRSLVFGMLILNVACRPGPLVTLPARVVGYLGKRSYGIYMYHPVAIGTSIWLVGHVGGFDLGTFFPSALLYGSTMTLTLALALLSYRFLETPLLALKRSFHEEATPDPVSLRFPPTGETSVARAG